MAHYWSCQAFRSERPLCMPHSSHQRDYVTVRSNQSMKPTAPLRDGFSVLATTPCRGLSLSRQATSIMHKVNTTKMAELTWSSPKGKFSGAGKEISEALGRKPESTDLNERHPFDVEILRIPPGKAPYSYHSHSAQWEFYHVISGSGVLRHKDGTTPIEAGDAFIFKPGEPHQITNDTAEDMILYVVADNPIGDTYYQPDSNKWGVPIPERRNVRSEPVDYFDGEE